VTQAAGPTLALELTRRCNRRCGYCYGEPLRPHDSDPTELPTAELLELLARLLPAGGFGQVQISGGEPLLRPDALEVMAWLRRQGLSVSLLSDGALIDHDLARALAKLGVGPVQLTLLATDDATHDRLKGVPGSLQASLAGLTALLEADVPVTLSFVCLKGNARKLKSVLELAFGLGLPTVALARFCPVGVGGRARAALAPSVAEVATALSIAQWGVQTLGLRVPASISLPHCSFAPERYPALSRGHCALLGPTPGFTLGPAGGVRACSISSARLGDALRTPWATLRREAERGYLAQARRLPRRCMACPRVRRCRGGCRETALSWHHEHGAMDPLAAPLPAGGPDQA